MVGVKKKTQLEIKNEQLNKAEIEALFKSVPDSIGKDGILKNILGKLITADDEKLPSKELVKNANILMAIQDGNGGEPLVKEALDFLHKKNPGMANLLKETMNNLMEEQIHYAHANVHRESRSHFYEATAFSIKKETFQNWKEEYQSLKGDALKTMILKNIKAELNDAIINGDPIQNVRDLKTKYTNGEEYKILQHKQGIASRVFSIETDSERAFEKLFKEFEIKAKENAKNKDAKPGFTPSN